VMWCGVVWCGVVSCRVSSGVVSRCTVQLLSHRKVMHFVFMLQLSETTMLIPSVSPASTFTAGRSRCLLCRRCQGSRAARARHCHPQHLSRRILTSEATAALPAPIGCCSPSC
jgi:hypothetical protein